MKRHSVAAGAIGPPPPILGELGEFGLSGEMA